MTSPDGQGLPDPTEDVGGWGADGGPLGALLAFGEQMVLWPFSRFLGFILNAPPEDFDTLAELFQNLIPAIIRRVLGNLTGALTGTGGSDLDQSTADSIIGNIPIIGDIVKVVGGVTSGLTGGMAAAATSMASRWSQLNAAETAANDALAIANTANDAVADLSAFVAAAKATQAYTGNYNDMVTVPRSLLVPALWSSSSHDHSSGSLSANTTTGSITGWTASGGGESGYMPSFRPAVQKYSPGSGTIYFTPIISDRNGSLDKFRFITGADSSLFSIDGYYIALMVYDIPAGKFRTLWNPGDIKDSMGSARSEVSISMGLTGAAAQVAPGQVLIAAHQQSAPGLAQTARSVAWVPQPGVARTSDVLLPGCYWRTSGNVTPGIPSEVDVSSLVSQNGGIPWYAVSVNNP